MPYREYKQSVTELCTKAGEEILHFWDTHHIFQRSIDSRPADRPFVFYEGPPSANGDPGIHHVMARTIKDIFCRYKTLKGYRVERKSGWDTHGLPIELQVEKELGIKKEDIGKKISIVEYNQKCRQAVMRYKAEWEEITRLIGFWVDLENPYITFTNEYIESCWWLLKQLYQKGLLYKGYTIQPYSPAAGTGLSSHELNQPGCYRQVKDTSVIAQFKIKGTDNDYLLAWTTTPWTLPSNTALAVGKDITYLKVKTHNQYTQQPVNIIFAKERFDYILGSNYVNRNDFVEGRDDKKIPYVIVEEFKGEILVGLEYEQLLPFVQPHENQQNAFKVYAADFVTTQEGSGIVHISPTFGADDARLAKQYNIPALLVADENGNYQPTVDKKGKFVDAIGEKLAELVQAYGIKTHKPLGKSDFYVKNYLEEDESQPNYKSTDVIISIILKEQNKAFRVEKYEHTYPHCWRTDKPILYFPLESWFVRTTALKDRLIALNKTIHWKPESTGTGRFGNWLENLVDWNLSRSRFWGTPLPIWRTQDGSEEICIGSLAELKAEIQKANVQLGLHQPTELPDLHRPYVDEIVLVSPSGKPMYREPDLVDVWFDSGAMPYAQWHYPFENADLIDQGIKFPADFICEGLDQTRGWFFTLHVIATLVFDSIAFKNVISTGLVLDANGEKMSKRLGNIIDPFQTVRKYGPDAVRWYMIANAAPWENLRFNLEGLAEMQRRFFGTLQNTYNFFALYANLDHFSYQESEVPLDQRTESDRWILSRLNAVIRQTEEAYSNYEPTNAARAILHFVVEELSNWYVRLNRKRFWKSEYNTDKIAAYQTLYRCLITVAKLMSPIAPFYADLLFRDLNNVTAQEKAISVHLTDFPVAHPEFDNPALEEKMQLAQTICSLAHSIRKEKKLRVRLPLQKMLLPALSHTFKEYVRQVSDLIMAETNVKSIEFIDDAEGLVTKKIKPNFSVLAKRGLGKQMKAIQEHLATMQTSDITAFQKAGQMTISTEVGEIILTPDDTLIESADIPGWASATQQGITVALDVTITPTLRKEGIARDLVNRIQNLRKEAGLDVQDKIHVIIGNHQRLINEAIAEFGQYIKAETQALSIELSDNINGIASYEIDEFMTPISISKA
ncbi:MAG: isoleucine--tRNA ligase [Cytophagales bacterium]|nr:isoleucine--tRNA ligase [Bernardetiaceae bacterium]MDW8211124.1 isoleucine--tRNA ligase [Cytophagales bacterium]